MNVTNQHEVNKMNNLLEFESVEPLSTKKPTLEEYTEAQCNYKNYCSWARMAQKRKNQLVDELALVRESELRYLKAAEEQKDIIRRYEFYKECEEKGEISQ